MFAIHLHPPNLLPMSAGLTWLPAAEQYWTVLVWFILPSIVAIWVVYLRKEERLRNMRRQVRQLEARLNVATPSAVPAMVVPAKVPTPTIRRPSALTAQILVNPVSIPCEPTFVSGTTHPV